MIETMHLRKLEINYIYKGLCHALLNEGKKVGNTREINDVCFVIDVSKGNIVSCRDISLPYLFGEMTWYLAGEQSVEFISKFASLWKRISDDGETSNSAYGNIMFSRYGFDQFGKVVELLKKDPHSRRAVININVPNPKVIETKDEPCTIMLQFLLRNGKLNCTGVMRSNDIWFGLPYDVVFFTEVQKEIARRLGVEVGTYTHFATSLHVYERDREKLIKVITTEDFDKIEVDFSPLWTEAHKIYAAVNESDNPKYEIMRQFENYGMYVMEMKL